MHFWDFNCPYPLRQLATISRTACTLGSGPTACRGSGASDGQLVLSAFWKGTTTSATISTSRLEPLGHPPPQSSEALGSWHILTSWNRPRLLRNALGVVREGPGKGGVLPIQALLGLADAVSNDVHPMARHAPMVSIFVAAGCAAPDGGRPRQMLLPTNCVGPARACTNNRRVEPPPRRVNSPSNSVGSHRAVNPVDGPLPCMHAPLRAEALR